MLRMLKEIYGFFSEKKDPICDCSWSTQLIKWQKLLLSRAIISELPIPSNISTMIDAVKRLAVIKYMGSGKDGTYIE